MSEDGIADRWWLGGVGPSGWAEIAARFDGWTGYWQAADGLTLGAIGPHQPWATHVWCWRGKTSARIRVDRFCHVAVLGSDREEVAALSTGGVEPATVIRHRSFLPGEDREPEVSMLKLWGAESRVPPLPAAISDSGRPWEMLVTVAEAPITFLRRD